MRDIVSSPHRVDGLMIASSIVPESERFPVLGAEEAVDEVVPMDGGAITALLKEMKGNFDVIIVDLPRHLFAVQKRLLASAHDIVLVTELSLAGIRDTLRIKNAPQEPWKQRGDNARRVAHERYARRARSIARPSKKARRPKSTSSFPKTPKPSPWRRIAARRWARSRARAALPKLYATLALKFGGTQVQKAEGDWWQNSPALSPS